MNRLKLASNVGAQMGLMQPVTEQRTGGPGAPLPAPTSSPMPVSVAPPVPKTANYPLGTLALQAFGRDLSLKGARR